MQQSEKIGRRVRERAVGSGGGFLLVLGALAWVGHAQAGGDDEDFRQGAFLAGLEQHPAERRVDGQAGQFAAERG